VNFMDDLKSMEVKKGSRMEWRRKQSKAMKEKFYEKLYYALSCSVVKCLNVL
jgi:hypothetical protein